MLISTNWLGRHVDLEGVDLAELADRFTLSVAEIEGVHTVGSGLESVVAGRVLEVHPIEGSKVQRTLVDTGGHGVRQIVCGAPNVAVGQLVCVALPGTTLGDLTIGESRIRGVESVGMICSESELGLSDDHAGILVLQEAGFEGVEPGTPLGGLIDLVDTIIEVDNKSLTHRPDLWGHRGLAREVAALLDRPLRPLALDVDFTTDRPISVQVEDGAACPRYLAVTLDGVTIQPSPMWLRMLLHRVGTRPINHVVDATNFVMLDLGNPLHAFDRRELSGDSIVVRRARAGEAFTTLDGREHALSPQDLLIADAERGVALAGVMGGENSEIREDTSSMVLESANFDAATIRMTGQRLGIRTESSSRFEKSLDPALAEQAARSFCRLLSELDPGVRLTSALVDVAVDPAPLPVIELRLDRVHARLGVDVGEARIVATLRRLEFGVEGEGTGVLRVTVPSFRATKDIGIEADLIEEVGRTYGYDNIEPQRPTISLGRPHPNVRKRFERAARAYLSGSVAFDELQTYSFAHDPFLARMGIQPRPRLTLRNPISAEMPGLRTDLTTNLLQVLEKNAREFKEIRVYELGRVFHPLGPASPDGGQDIPAQPVMLAGLYATTTEGADDSARLFFQLKGVLAGLSRAVERAPLRLEQGGVSEPWAHPIRQARVLSGDVYIGVVGEVHPQTLHHLDVRQSAAFFEIDLDAWRATERHELSYSPLARFPSVYRDFAVLVGREVPAGWVRDAISAAAPDLIRDVSFHSVYMGPGIAPDGKSLAWSVTIRHDDRTLEDAEVRDIEAAVWRSLEERVGGSPRA